MRAHVVISSHEAIVNDGFFKNIKWAGLIVDEGQRLKNDENQLYSALKTMKFPFRVLLTGQYFPFVERDVLICSPQELPYRTTRKSYLIFYIFLIRN